MTLGPGTRLGSYEIVSPIGAGGMGEVYRARDTKLQREVAVKVLPDALARDTQALARFEREAQAVAALSHPGILSIYDFGREDGVAFAVMELLEGDTLRARLAEGPLPQRKALELAQQIAQALAAAHEKGIVHRDLKPENLFLTRGGRVKVLDFGLARQVPFPSGDSDTHSPTVKRETEPGTVLGTVGYMSPEQVRGRPADARSDIFSFGAVLHEMLTGRRAFQRGTAAETMTAILREDPRDLSATGVSVSPGLERILRHCLEKDPEERFRTAHDLAFALDAVGGSSATLVEGAPPETAAGPRRVKALTAVALAIGAAAAALLVERVMTREPPPPYTAVRALTYSGHDAEPAVSPDGRWLAFSSNRDDTLRIWLKQLATGDEVALTSGPDFTPRFSPDGSQLLFNRGAFDLGPIAGATKTDLYRVPVLGGEPRRVASSAASAEWTADGILFTRIVVENGKIATKLFKVAPEGGEPLELAGFDGRIADRPRLSPDGRTIAVRSDPASGTGSARFELVSSDTRQVRTLLPPPSLGTISSGLFSRDSKGLLFVQQLSVRYGGSRLVRQDLRSGEGRPLLYLPYEVLTLDALSPERLVADASSTRENLFELSLDGTPGKRWLTRGTSTDRQPVYSPDGAWLAFSSDRGGNLDIWMISTKTGALHRVTEDPADDWDPGFTRAGKLIWSSGRSGHLEIWMAEADGSSPRRVSDDGMDAENPTELPDGTLIYVSGNQKKPGLWKVKPDGSKTERLLEGLALQLPEVSPDGAVVAYAQGWVGPVLFARVADGKALPMKIDTPHTRYTSVNMGRARWSGDGRRVYFVGQNEKGRNGIYVQDFDPAKADTRATRREAGGFEADVETESFAISPDGTRMVIAGLERLDTIVTVEGVAGTEPFHRVARR